MTIEEVARLIATGKIDSFSIGREPITGESKIIIFGVNPESKNYCKFERAYTPAIVLETQKGVFDDIVDGVIEKAVEKISKGEG